MQKPRTFADDDQRSYKIYFSQLFADSVHIMVTFFSLEKMHFRRVSTKFFFFLSVTEAFLSKQRITPYHDASHVCSVSSELPLQIS